MVVSLMRNWIVVAALAAFSTLGMGCSALRDLRESAREQREGADKVGEALEQAGKVVSELQEVNQEAFEAADKDKDGKLLGDEWITYLLLGGLTLKQHLDKRAVVAQVKQVVAPVAPPQA